MNNSVSRDEVTSTYDLYSTRVQEDMQARVVLDPEFLKWSRYTYLAMLTVYG